MSEKSYQTSLSFFKIFDLAFFAPGLFIAIHLGFLYVKDLKALNADLSTTGGAVLAVITVVGIIYAIGVGNFAISRSILDELEHLIPSSRDAKAWRPTFPMKFSGETRVELMLYFWYLRSTTHALGVAFLISGCLLWQLEKTFTTLALIFGEWFCAYFLFKLSKDYKWNLEHTTLSQSSNNEASARQKLSPVATISIVSPSVKFTVETSDEVNQGGFSG
jgi:hypothetical protein